LDNFRLGRRIAIDFGAARIGVAISSIDGIIASPLATIPNNDSAIRAIEELLAEHELLEIYVGLPLNLQGERTLSTEAALTFAHQLAVSGVANLRMLDERMSTRAAQSQLHASGKNTKQSRSVIDAAAASLILESAIAFEKSTGRLPGKSITEFHE